MREITNCQKEVPAGWLASEAKQVCPWMGDPDAAGSGIGGPGGGTFSSGLKKCPRAVIGDIAMCRVPSFVWDVKQVS